MNYNNAILEESLNTTLDVSVLYIEEDKKMRLAMSKFLKQKVSRLSIAKDGKEGLDLFFKHKPDILIVDTKLPLINGLEMIKKIDSKADTKIYLTSEYSDRESLLDAIDAGIDHFLLKPINFEKLDEYLNKDYEEKRLKKQQAQSILKIKKSERYFKELFNNALVGIYQTSSDGKILWTNPALYKMLGYSSLAELSASINAKDVYANKEKRKHIVSVLNKKGHINAVESKWITKYKKNIYVRETAHKTVDDEGNVVYIGTIENITREKKAEFKLLQIAIELKNLMDNASIPIIGIDKYKRISDWNAAAQDLFVYKKQDVTGKDFSELLVPKTEIEKLNIILQSALEGKEINNYKCNLKTQQNKYLKILLNTTVKHDYYGNIKGVMIILHDISEIEEYKTKLEKKVIERTNKLKLALEREKELGKLKTRFIAMASHEFRTPLAAINFAAGFLKKYDTKLDTDQKNKKFQKIETQVKHMTKLLESILHIEKNEQKQEFAKPQIIRFKDFIEPIIQEACAQTNYSHKVELSIDKIDDMIYIDMEKGRSIFLNLIINAIKYSPDENKIYIRCYCENNKTIVEIKDLGMGINPKEIELIYDKFHRGTNVETIQGTGLGLSIVKSGVNLHNADISVKSKLGEGSTFTLRFPLNNLPVPISKSNLKK
jgi:PAS domain S-box-containing protein